MNLEVLAASGEVEVFVALDPQSFNLLESGQAGAKYIWSAKSQGGLAMIEMDVHHESFHVATFYYVLIKAIS